MPKDRPEDFRQAPIMPTIEAQPTRRSRRPIVLIERYRNTAYLANMDLQEQPTAGLEKPEVPKSGAKALANTARRTKFHRNNGFSIFNVTTALRIT
jgi:hypothetical protein